MPVISVDDPKSAISFLESLELPETPAQTLGVTAAELESEGFESADLPAPPSYDGGIEQAVTVGSQIAGFSDEVPVELRPQIANSFLLAQLAANRHIEDSGGNATDWYHKYIEVLSNVGWLVEGDASAVRSVEGSVLEVHKEIISVITVALGPMAAAAPIILAVLNGLKNMSKDDPWITLFNRESQRASANQFQISYASVDGQNPRITLACFELDAHKTVTQVLFFKFDDSHASLKQFESKMSVNGAVFDTVNSVVEDKIKDYIHGYVTDIKI